MLDRAYNTSANILRRNTIAPYKRISAAVAREKDIFSMPFVGLGELMKESVRLPLENISHLMGWTTRRMASVLGSTVKLGLKSAMLIPLPLPGGQLTLARMMADARAMKLTYEQKVLGSPERFTDIFARIRGIRNDAEQRSTISAPAARAT